MIELASWWVVLTTALHGVRAKEPTTQANAPFIGIDVAKADLAVGCARQLSTLANEPASIDRWLRSVPTGSVLAMAARLN